MCGKCHSECSGCRGRLATDCKSCRNYHQMTDTNGFKCVRNCSKGFYDAGSKLCSRCNSHCSVCHGPQNSECSECKPKSVRIYRELPSKSTGKDDFNDTIYSVEKISIIIFIDAIRLKNKLFFLKVLLNLTNCQPKK